MLKGVRELVGDDDHFLWSTDCPHSDGAWPRGVQEIAALSIPEGGKQKLKADNAAQAFRLDT